MNMEWLQDWYNRQCDGIREHMYGIKIETLDNPGWEVKIDLADTLYEKCENLKKNLKNDFGDTNWMICNMDSKKFYGYGDVSKLSEILETFKMWIQELDNEFTISKY